MTITTITAILCLSTVIVKYRDKSRDQTMDEFEENDNCCPECEMPNCFGEMCKRCSRELEDEAIS